MLKYLRNREVKILVALLLIITFISTLAGFIISIISGILAFSSSILISACALVFTIRRYLQIEKLSDYLKEVSRGSYTLDIRDNNEGELSILKSDIYKVTVMLSEQAEFLQNDKLRLSNAIADISHQIKTPLTSMFLMTELLYNENTPPDKKKEFIGKIYTQLERLQWLVSSLLKLSKLDAGTVLLKKESAYIEEFISKFTEPLLIPMEIKEQELLLEGNNKAQIVCDMNWTSEAFVNILKNCIEHTPEKGRISILFSENPLYSQIIIKDNGGGISKEDIPNIFKRFYKGKNSNVDSIGIGLAMAKSIIEKQNGSISVKSELGIGTEFTIRFYTSRHLNG